MIEYREPAFSEPSTSTFIYAAWSVSPRRIGPFVRPSAPRTRWIDRVRRTARELRQHADVEAVRLFETSFIAPLPGIPKYDVVLLIRVRDGQADAVRRDPRLRALQPATTFTATNAARFGDTEAVTTGADILLNHFTGTADRQAAVAAWRRISAWYLAKPKVDNSTLLSPDGSAPYVLVNYARLPGRVVPFLLQQLFRPSFHRYVRPLLNGSGLTVLPLFVRHLPLETADD